MVKNYLPIQNKRFGGRYQFILPAEAEDVDSAYELAITTEPDAIFLDINLIGGEGFYSNLLELIR